MPLVEFFDMPDGIAWFLRPAGRGMCLYESLHNGVLDLNAVAEMNEWLNVEDANRALLQEAINKGK